MNKGNGSRGRKEGIDYVDIKQKEWLLGELLWRKGEEDKEARFLTGVIGCFKMLFIVL